MSDQLEFKVDTRTLAAAKQALDAVTQASRGTEKAATDLAAATRRAGQSDQALVTAATQASGAVTQQGRAAAAAALQSDQMSRAMMTLSQQARGASGSIRQLAGALGLAFSVREAMSVADAYTTMVSRLRLVTASEADRATTLRTLNGIADRTRTLVTDTAELYVKLRQANEGLGYSTQQTANLTEAFGLALKVSGASGATAASAIQQFAQAMAKGAANGDEFVTVSEAAPEVLRIVQKELGVSRAKLLEMKEAGELTAKVIGDALLKNLERLRGQVGDAPQTIADGFTALRNSVIRVVGASSDLQTATRNIAQGLASVGKFLEENGPVLLGLAKTAALFYGVTRAMQAATVALGALNTAAAAGGAASVIRNLVTLAGGPFGFAVKAAALVVGGVDMYADSQTAARDANRNSRREAFQRLSPMQQAQTAQAIEADVRRLERMWDTQRAEDGSLLMGEERSNVARALRIARENRDLMREIGVGTNRVSVMASPDIVGPSGKKVVDDMGNVTPLTAYGITRMRPVETARLLSPGVPTESGMRRALYGTGQVGETADKVAGRVVGEASKLGGTLRNGFDAGREAARQLAADMRQNLQRGVYEGFRQPIADFLMTWKFNAKSMGDLLRQSLANAIASVAANELTRFAYQLAGLATGGGGGGGGGKGGGGGIGLGSLVDLGRGAFSFFGGGGGSAGKIANTTKGASAVASGGGGAAAALAPLGLFTVGAGFAAYAKNYSGGNAAARAANEAFADNFARQQLALAQRRADDQAYLRAVGDGMVIGGPAGYDVAGARALAVSGNTINIVVPEGTPRQQAESIVRELQSLAGAQSGNPSKWSEVNVS